MSRSRWVAIGHRGHKARSDPKVRGRNQFPPSPHGGRIPTGQAAERKPLVPFARDKTGVPRERDPPRDQSSHKFRAIGRSRSISPSHEPCVLNSKPTIFQPVPAYFPGLARVGNRGTHCREAANAYYRDPRSPLRNEPGRRPIQTCNDTWSPAQRIRLSSGKTILHTYTCRCDNSSIWHQTRRIER